MTTLLRFRAHHDLILLVTLDIYAADIVQAQKIAENTPPKMWSGTGEKHLDEGFFEGEAYIEEVE